MPRDEWDRIEQARLAREAEERRKARRSHPHPAAEDSWFPPIPKEGREGDGNPPSTPPPSKGTSIKFSITALKDLAWLGAAIVAGVTWFQNRASMKDVTDSETRAVTKCAEAVASALAPIPPRIKKLEEHAKKDDQRWDRLDETNASATRKPNTPAPQKFGPKAEHRGEVRYEEETEP